MKNIENSIRSLVVLVSLAMVFVTVSIRAGDGSGITITYPDDDGGLTPVETVETIKVATDQAPQVQSGPTYTWQSGSSQQPQIVVNVTNNVTVQTQPVVACAPAKVVVVRRGFWKSVFSVFHASASVDYNWYDEGSSTYWEINSSANERYNYRNTQRLYSGHGDHYYNSGGGYRYSGGNRHSGGHEFIESHVRPGRLYAYE